MDQGGGRVSRRVRELRSDLVLSQTRAGGWTADSPRFAIAQDVRSRRRVLRRMDADQFSALRSRRQPESACRSRDEGRPQETFRLDVWRWAEEEQNKKFLQIGNRRGIFGVPGYP